jgi:hypothetical protein
MRQEAVSPSPVRYGSFDISIGYAATRVQPCSNCSSRGFGASCVFAVPPVAQTWTPDDRGHGISETSTQATRPGTANMQTRIDQLESLVLDLMHQNESSLRPTLQESQSATPHTPASIHFESTPVLPSPSDHGTLSTRSARVSYVGSTHWAAVLDSITELRNHLAQEEDAINLPPDLVSSLISFPKPQLLYNDTMYETPVSIIKSLPPRSVVDRLVSRYFNVLDIAPGTFPVDASKSFPPVYLD